jgi:hypothetical protein
MTIEKIAEPRIAAPPRAAIWQLAVIEGRRMLRHPAPWFGLTLSVWFAYDVFQGPTWTTGHYEELPVSIAPLLLGISLASVSAFGREHLAVADDAPMQHERRSFARLLGGLPLVGLAALVVGVGTVWLRARGGLELGDEPGRTEHAYYSVPELLQLVLLAGFAVALGAAVVHVVRHRLVASIVLVIYWFLLFTYWLFQWSVSGWLTPLQVQPRVVEIGSASPDPASLPSDWLLSAPSDYQDSWGRVVISPALAGWHNVYLVGLTALVVAIAVPGRLRRPLLAGGGLLAMTAVVLQAVVSP